MVKKIVIIGAGWTGLPLAFKILKYTLPKVDLQVTLVSPNSHFFWNVAATRAIIPGQISDSQMFLPIAKGFDKYPSESFQFVLGTAKSINRTSNSLNVTLNSGVLQTLEYDQLVIATGSRLSSNLPFKPIGTHEETLADWKILQKRIGEAKTVVVGGAGPTGVEVAGELAAHYGSSKVITLVSSGSQLLDRNDVLPSVRAVTEEDLKSLGVNILKGVRVNDARVGSKSTTLSLSNGKELVTDCYLALHGVTVNTSFVPEEFLDDHKNIKLDENMRVEGAKNIWAIGDVGNKEPKQITITDNQIIYLGKALDAALTGAPEMQAYKPEKKPMIFLSFGTKYATGQVGSWKLFGFLVAYVKGRRLFVDTAPSYVAGDKLRHSSL